MNRRLLVASAFWVLLLAAVIGAVAAVVWNRHRAVQDQLSAIEPRYARILGLEAERARMEQVISRSREALSPRERQLIGFVRQGLRNRAIAEQLGVTEGTVKTYLHAMFEKLGVGSRTELAIRADEFLA